KTSQQGGRQSRLEPQQHQQATAQLQHDGRVDQLTREMVGFDEIVDDRRIGEFSAAKQQEIRCETDAAEQECNGAEIDADRADRRHLTWVDMGRHCFPRPSLFLLSSGRITSNRWTVEQGLPYTPNHRMSHDPPDRFLLAGVMGWPVMHSRSPALHNYWLAKHGL